MPFAVEVPPSASARPATAGRAQTGAAPIRIGLVNNMPDSALEGTEAQFAELLTAAAGAHEVRLCLSHLPAVTRSPEAEAMLRERYWPLERLRATPLDALIVTGAEPREPSLRQERYWDELVDLLSWAESHTASSVWSCLAAHAVVLELDGIERRLMSQKCCGIFDHTLEPHPLTTGMTTPARVPHSRWNDLLPEELEDAGYSILARSEESGAGIFVKKRGTSLLVFVHGHPEYDERALLKEYQRDVGRFLSGEYEQYPTIPAHYFSQEVISLLERFRSNALEHRNVERVGAFPFTEAAACLDRAWREPAVRFYRNWLAYLASEGRPTRLHDHVSSRR